MQKDQPINEIKLIIARLLGAGYVASVLKYFTDIQKAYLSQKWETCCTKAGKFVEALLKGLHFHTTHRRLSRINVGQEIDRLNGLPRNSFNPSIRLLIPRVCRCLYYIASDRGGRHDVTGFDPNRMDAEIVVAQTSYIVAELIRLFHPNHISPADAQVMAEQLTRKKIPLVITVFGKKRILDPDLKHGDKVLILLYDSYPKEVAVKDLFQWIEHKNITDFKRKILKILHSKRMIEYHNDVCLILPPGIKHVEEHVI